MDKDLAAAPKQQGGEELPEPVAKIHSDGYWTEGKSFKEPLNFASMELYTADQLRTAIAAERARTADTHAAYCHSQQQFHDAVAELSTLRQQLAEAWRDAERYRWLKSKAGFGIRRNQVTELSVMLDTLPNHINELDAAIDAAIAAQGEAK